MSLFRAVFGRPLANREFKRRKIGAFEGVPAMGLDALGSSAYGPEAALTILMPLGAAGLAWLGYVMLPILALLGILFVSYRQTIRAYPTNGGAYTVAKENLGANASLLAASALMIDYVLNVAVGISAGVGALVSAVPELHPYITELCLGILALITVVNLRGTLDAGRLFAIPTYTFVLAFLFLIAAGLYRSLISAGHPVPVMAPPGPEQATEAVGLWILLRAFASGCTAMTGVEAISNGVSAFRDPPVKYGLRTLTAVVAILALLLAGISYLVLAYNVGAMDQTREGYQSVLSQLASAVVGRNWLYYVAIGSLLSVLSISANTSFVDFPRLCRLVAQDGYLPRAFAIVGRRLVFSVGVLYLAGTAGALIVIFGGITDRLIPLFAIGAFLTFTISQTGMVVHWRRELRQHTRSSAHPRASLILNATGAVSTGVALFIIVIAKFAEGAWITLLAIPAAILLLKSIGRYYQTLSWRLREKRPLELVHAKPPIVLVATENWNRLTDKALSFAMTISPDVYAVHLCSTEGPATDDAEVTLRREWERDVERPAREKGLRPPELLMFEAQYRQLYIPLLKLIGTLQREHSDRMIAVLLPELVKQHWWEHLLHTHRARRIRSVLLQYGGPRLVVISVPWRLARSSLTGDLKEEMRTRLTSPSRDRPPTPAASSGANVRAQSPLAE